MTSIQQQAAKLVEEFKSCGDEYSETDIAYRMADFLRSVANVGGDVEPVASIHAFGSLINCDPYPSVAIQPKEACRLLSDGVHDLYTEFALVKSKLDAFEAGRRKGLEDAAEVCKEHKDDTLAADLYRMGAKWCEASIRELINKEA